MLKTQERVTDPRRGLVEYHCARCPRIFGDPEDARHFDFWVFTIREHVRTMHSPEAAAAPLVNQLILGAWT